MKTALAIFLVAAFLVTAGLNGCGDNSTLPRVDGGADAADARADVRGSGGRIGSGGAGGLKGSGGAVGSGGLKGSGGAIGSGGLKGSGGAVGSGGKGSGGAVGSGGKGSGGAVGSGGVKGSGGATTTACTPDGSCAHAGDTCQSTCTGKYTLSCTCNTSNVWAGCLATACGDGGTGPVSDGSVAVDCPTGVCGVGDFTEGCCRYTQVNNCFCSNGSWSCAATGASCQ